MNNCVTPPGRSAYVAVVHAIIGHYYRINARANYYDDIEACGVTGPKENIRASHGDSLIVDQQRLGHECAERSFQVGRGEIEFLRT